MNKDVKDVVTEIFSGLARGRVLDIGSGGFKQAVRLVPLGFTVECCDFHPGAFKEKGEIASAPSGPRNDNVTARSFDLTKPWPYADASFDHALCSEVIEHVENPHHLVREAARVVKPGGAFVLTTPNILNISSRLRFLGEGFYDFFRSPMLEEARRLPEPGAIHINPVSYIEAEYIFDKAGFRIERVLTNRIKAQARLLGLLKPLCRMQCALKARHERRKGGIAYERIFKALLSDELFLGQHLILVARKAS